MFEELKSLENNEKIYRNDILKILKKWAKKISIFDIMESTYRFREACKYVRDEYKGHFDDIYVKNFYMRVKDIINDNNGYDGFVNKKKFLKSIDFFQDQNKERTGEDIEEKYNNQRLIYYLICIYTTYVLNEPIHHEGSVFPGHTKVRYDNGVYYCPVKSNNSNNPKAVCRYCIAVQG
ncbi:hypothetical protein MBCUT_03430 [Methanobrevibacter cuticularis]|uniref:UPF0305 protein MBCUT_03430 n=1 Tax=Methanobrevibacter cuticularis TaxID=47311 RepID=A0A166EXB2_9EURY|nr:DUF2115 family protein [Methanobrevibacter cuticularis]KZX17111.1 hypothetical protein MBCUT_03430 [Methanobrevibacter cuticularis]